MLNAGEGVGDAGTTWPAGHLGHLLSPRLFLSCCLLGLSELGDGSSSFYSVTLWDGPYGNPPQPLAFRGALGAGPVPMGTGGDASHPQQHGP